MNHDSGSETSKKFEAHISPVRGALIDVLEAWERLGERWGSLPDAESQAMAEIAAEGDYIGTSPWGDEPVRQAHNLGSLLLLAATDCAGSACRLLADEPTPIYSHLVLARASIEQAGRAWWLLDPEIGIRMRVARGANERIHALTQQTRLPLEPSAKKRAIERRALLFEEASRLGFRKVGDRRRSPYLDQERPTSTSLIRQLLGDDEDEELGRVLYAFLSAVAHGTTHGLSQSISVDAPGGPRTPGVTWGAVYTASRDVCTVLTAMILALGRAHAARDKLFGWTSEEVDQRYLHAVRQGKRSLGI